MSETAPTSESAPDFPDAITAMRRHATTLKAVGIGLLSCLLMIPLGLVAEVIDARAWRQREAQTSIASAWGPAQLVAGPVLELPFSAGRLSSEERYLTVLPVRLDIEAEIVCETRYRGPFRVLLYRARLKVSGSFEASRGLDALPAGGRIAWDRARLAVGLTDLRAIEPDAAVRWAGETVRFEPGTMRGLGNALERAMVAEVDVRPGDEPGEEADPSFAFEVTINGVDALDILPLGDATTVAMTSDWPAPSFRGLVLPTARTVRSDGFEANWRVSQFARPFPGVWEGDLGEAGHQAGFGVRLIDPVSPYRLSERAVKYGLLVIALTFVTAFVFERWTTVALSGVQYTLIGLALSVFYLLLLSLSEFVGFAAAYAISSVAVAGQVSAYALTVGAGRRGAALLGGLLLGLYAFLYVTLSAETYALLAGSLALFIALSAIMAVTRKLGKAEAEPDLVA